MPRGVYDRNKKVEGSDVVVERVEAVVAEPVNTDADEMNALALRIWDGQGSIPLIERVERIVNALKAKGYDTTKLVLPDPGYKKYL